MKVRSANLQQLYCNMRRLGYENDFIAFEKASRIHQEPQRQDQVLSHPS